MIPLSSLSPTELLTLARFTADSELERALFGLAEKLKDELDFAEEELARLERDRENELFR